MGLDCAAKPELLAAVIGAIFLEREQGAVDTFSQRAVIGQGDAVVFGVKDRAQHHQKQQFSRRHRVSFWAGIRVDTQL